MIKNRRRAHKPGPLPRRDGRELGDGVHVARGAVAGGRDAELRAADPVGIVDINLARAQAQLLVRLACDAA